MKFMTIVRTAILPIAFVSASAIGVIPGVATVAPAFAQAAAARLGDLASFRKIAVDSVNLASRIIYLRMGFDPNCGFRSFATGIPTS